MLPRGPHEFGKHKLDFPNSPWYEDSRHVPHKGSGRCVGSSCPSPSAPPASRKRLFALRPRCARGSCKLLISWFSWSRPVSQHHQELAGSERIYLRTHPRDRVWKGTGRQCRLPLAAAHPIDESVGHRFEPPDSSWSEDTGQRPTRATGATREVATSHRHPACLTKAPFCASLTPRLRQL